MDQTEYVNYLVQAINDNNEIIVDLKKLKSFHKEMLWFNAIDSHSVYYENIFSPFQNKLDLNSVIHKLLKNTKTPLSFFEHLFSKYPEFIISSYQDSIVDFPLDYFPTLFPKTILSPLKTTQCLFKLFKKTSKDVLQYPSLYCLSVKPVISLITRIKIIGTKIIPIIINLDFVSNSNKINY